MDGYNAKNYTAQGGAVTVIGGELHVLGKLTIDPNAEVVGLSDPHAGAIAATEFAPASAQPDSTATTAAQLRADFNLLLANLRAAGVLASDDP